MEDENTNDKKNKFEELVKKLHDIRLLMQQQTVTCEFSGDRVLVIDKENVPEYLGPEIQIGSMDILPESYQIPLMKGIMDALVASELISVYKSYP